MPKLLIGVAGTVGVVTVGYGDQTMSKNSSEYCMFLERPGRVFSCGAAEVLFLVH